MPAPFANKLLVLRYKQLGRLPPALYSTEIFLESGIPVRVLEFGYTETRLLSEESPIPKTRFVHLWARFLPSKLRATLVFLSDLLCLLRTCSAGKPTVCFAHGIQEYFLAYSLHLFYKVPFAAYVHEIYEHKELSPLNWFLHLFEKKIFQNAAFLVFPQADRREFYRQTLHYTCPDELVYICPRARNRVPPRRLREELHLDPKSFLMGFIGGIGRDNALEIAIEAVAKLTNVHLLIWGWAEDEYLKSLKLLVLRLGVSHQVHFLGELGDNKWASLAACDVSYCVYLGLNIRTRYGSTASNKLFESLTMGVPILTNSRPDFAAFLEQHPVGLALETESSQAVASSIQWLIDNPSKRLQMAQTGVALSQTVFHFEHQFEPVKQRFYRYFQPCPQLSTEVNSKTC